MERLEIFQKNTKTIKVTVSDNGAPFDLTGFTAHLAVKKDSSSPMLFEVTGSISGSEITFVISSDNSNQDSGNYLFDVTIVKVSEEPDVIYTVTSGSFIINDSAKY